jgi:peroxiredoxin
MNPALVVTVMLLATRGAGACALAGEPAPEPKNYVVFPVKTELQRYLLFSTNSDAYAQIDVARCVHDKKFDLQRLDAESFRNDLVALVKHTGASKPSLQLSFRYADVSLDPDETKRMEATVTNICRQAGFADVGTSMSGEGDSWARKAALFARVADESDASESSIEDELIRVYPVRTKLSRFLLYHPDDDCFVVLRQPFDGRFTEFSPAMREELGRLIAKLDVPTKRRLVIRFRATQAGQDAIQRYFRRRLGEPAPADPFLKQLGFESANYSISPTSVNPEKLLGKRAPDFTLDALTGGQIHLHDMIRGRVALISFWGVACGPCRAEAPHLTALYNRFRDKGLAMVAVNAYDESKQDVDRFARANGLAHPIALMGKKVGEEQYTVTSYPVTFLVDHTGAIVDYHPDFEPGDEKVLATAIARLLAEREKAVTGK